MSRIVQIAVGQHVLKAVYTGNSPLPVLLWALVEDEGRTDVIGIVLDPNTKELVRADELEGFRGYTD
jgi:hypothetical protein